MGGGSLSTLNSPAVYGHYSASPYTVNIYSYGFPRLSIASLGYPALGCSRPILAIPTVLHDSACDAFALLGYHVPVSANCEDSGNGIVNRIVSDMIPINPIELKGPWAAGFALDIHTISSQYLGDDAFGHAQFDTKRSAVGELLYQLKSHGDKSGIDALCDVAHSFVAGKGWKADVIVSVPPSRPGRRLQAGTAARRRTRQGARHPCL